jgi:transposase InsO family protein
MMQLEGVLDTARACELAQVNRATFYRWLQDRQPRQQETTLRDAVQRIVIENRCYGYRRVTAELRAQSWVVNQKRVLRVMREDNLLCLRKRRYPFTTDSRHPFGVFPI